MLNCVGDLMPEGQRARAAAVRRVTLTVPGKGPQEGVLTRFIPGHELHELPEDILVGVKDDFTRQMVINVWLGNFDWHLRNVRLDKNGFLHAIDAGYAVVCKDKSPVGIMAGAVTPRGNVHAALWVPVYCGRKARGTKENTLYQWMDRMLDLMDYDQTMVDTVKAIRQLCADEAKMKGELRKVVGKRVPGPDGKPQFVPDENQIQEIYELYKAQGDCLEEVLKAFFDKRNRGGRTSWVPPGYGWPSRSVLACAPRRAAASRVVGRAAA